VKRHSLQLNDSKSKKTFEVDEEWYLPSVSPSGNYYIEYNDATQSLEKKNIADGNLALSIKLKDILKKWERDGDFEMNSSIYINDAPSKFSYYLLSDHQLLVVSNSDYNEVFVYDMNEQTKTHFNYIYDKKRDELIQPLPIRVAISNTGDYSAATFAYDYTPKEWNPDSTGLVIYDNIKRTVVMDTILHSDYIVVEPIGENNFIFAGNDGSYSIFFAEVAIENSSIKAYKPHTSGIVSIDISKDNKKIVTASLDRSIAITDLQGNCLFRESFEYGAYIANFINEEMLLLALGEEEPESEKYNPNCNLYKYDINQKIKEQLEVPTVWPDGTEKYVYIKGRLYFNKPCFDYWNNIDINNMLLYRPFKPFLISMDDSSYFYNSTNKIELEDYASYRIDNKSEFFITLRRKTNYSDAPTGRISIRSKKKPREILHTFNQMDSGTRLDGVALELSDTGELYAFSDNNKYHFEYIGDIIDSLTVGIEEENRLPVNLEIKSQSDDILSIEFPESISGNGTYAIFDLLGKEVSSGNTPIVNGFAEIKIEEQVAGIYMLRITLNNRYYTAKFIKK
jgi:hypothetical protein